MENDSAWLATAVYQLLDDLMPFCQGKPSLSPEHEDQFKDVSASAAMVFSSAPNPDKLERETIHHFEELLDNGRYTWRDRAIARGMLVSLICAGRQAVEVMKELRGEDGCDPGGGPLAPEDRDLDEPW
ncbi:hypothetical protein GOL99_17665 [Sinorhizobium medicae]|nr:hypothetical protein [Sinorhizobium medicae]